MNALDCMVRMVGSDKFHYTAGARADASFLTSDGELNQRLEHGFGQVLERDDSPAATEESIRVKTEMEECSGYGSL
jgi:hypothetical protein